MAITNASRLADFGSGIGTEGAVIQVDNTNKRVGIGTTNPQAMLQVGTAVTVYGNSGIISATTFKGDLTGNADTATTATTASGLTGSPNITINNLVGVAATFTGTLAYEDVTNIDSVGIITAQSYVSIADSIVHTGDTDTSLRFPAANTFTVETAGSERVRVDSSGNLGVGIATPATSRRLHIADSTTAFSQWTTDNTGISHVDGTLVGVQADNSFQIWNYEDSYFRISTNNAERFRIDQGGNVNITGVTTATSFTDDGGSLRSIPLRAVTGSAATLVLTDAGKVVSTNTTGWTVPALSWAAGDTVTLLNNSAGGLVITCSAVTTYLTTDGTTVTGPTLGARGMATLYFVSSSVAYLQGTSLS